MCSVSSVVEKRPAPSNRILISAPMKAHQIHFVCLPVLILLPVSYQGNSQLERSTSLYRKVYCI